MTHHNSKEEEIRVQLGKKEGKNKQPIGCHRALEKAACSRHEKANSLIFAQKGERWSDSGSKKKRKKMGYKQKGPEKKKKPSSPGHAAANQEKREGLLKPHYYEKKKEGTVGQILKGEKRGSMPKAAHRKKGKRKRHRGGNKGREGQWDPYRKKKKKQKGESTLVPGKRNTSLSHLIEQKKKKKQTVTGRKKGEGRLRFSHEKKGSGPEPSTCKNHPHSKEKKDDH